MDEILSLIESVSEGFPSYSWTDFGIGKKRKSLLREYRITEDINGQMHLLKYKFQLKAAITARQLECFTYSFVSTVEQQFSTSIFIATASEVVNRGLKWPK